MKVYLFYLVDEYISSSKYAILDPIMSETNFSMEDLIGHNKGYDTMLYAFTPDKKIAKEFKMSRDMSKFIPLELNMTSEMYDDFIELYDYALIEAHSLMSSYTDLSGIVRVRNVSIYCPLAESSAIIMTVPEVRDNMSAILEDMMMTGTYATPTKKYRYNAIQGYLDMFNDNIKSALSKLGIYDQFYEYSGLEIYEPSGYEEDGLPFSVVSIDTLYMYCSLFGNTYKDDLTYSIVESR